MPVYYLIVGNTIKQEIDTDTGVIALPILEGDRAVSLLNKAHVLALMNNGGWNASQVINKLGLVDLRE